MANKNNCWVRMTPDSPYPTFAVIGESDKDDGLIIYVGRSAHEGGVFPARIDSNKHCAYISWAGSQIKKTDYEILVGENFRFEKVAFDGIPLSAVCAGKTADGDPLWIGRGEVKGKSIIGKIHPIHRCLFVAFEGEEHRLDSYEVLIREPSQLRPPSSEKGDGPAKVEIIEEVCPLQPTPCSAPKPETVAPAVEPVPDSSIDVPTDKLPQPPADKDSEISKEETTPKNDDDASPKCEDDNMQVESSIGTETIGNTPNWVRSEFDNIPPKAVIIGEDTDEAITYVGRAKNLPAKIIPERKVAYISDKGLEIPIKDDFEFLEGDGYRWVEGKQSGDNIPEGAVSTGISDNGRRVYVGRGRHLNIWIPGKVFEADYSVYIPYFYKEHRLTTYEILVCPLPPPPPPCPAPKPETVAPAVEPVPDSSIDVPTDKLPQPPADKDSETLKEETTPKNDDDASPKCEDDNMQVASSPGTETIENTPNWVRSEFDNIPPKAVILGEDTDKSIIYVGRAKNLPAKIIPERKLVYIPDDGLEILIEDDFEFLEGDGYRWVEGKQSGDNIPEGAVSTGISDGRRVYVGRGRHLNVWMPGKVFEADYSVYIPYFYEEHRLTTYEILVCPLSPPPPPCSAPNPETVAAAVEPVPDSSIDLPTEKLPQSPTDKDSEIPKEETTPKNDDDDSPKCEDDNMQVASSPGTETIGNTPNWVRSEFDNIPPKAVIIGEDTDKSITYVGRAKNLPAKIIPEKKVVYISNEGIEIPIKDDFEFLEGDGYRWVEGKQSGDNIPEGAVSTGISDDGRRVYVGRGRHLDIWIPGKVFEADYGVYIPYSTKEHRLTTYEILVCPLSPPPPPCSAPKPETVAAAVEPVPDSSIDLPTEKLPQSPTDKDSEIPKEETTPKNDDDDSPKCEDDNMQVASSPGTETIGNTPNWVRSEFDNIPPKAVIIGEDTDKTITYVGRAKNLPAKIIPEKEVVYISNEGIEIPIKDDFEFLEGDGYRWVEGKQSGDNIPEGAVSTGISDDGRRVYVGRGRHLDIWIPGKVFEADYGVYIPYSTKEHRLTTYEILVCPLSPPPPPCSAPKPETVAAAVEPVPDSSIDLPTEKLPQSPTDKDSEIPKEETTPKNNDDDSPKCEDDNMQVASSPGTETIGNTPNWVRSEFDNIPPKAVIIGEDTDKSITYVGRAKNLPAKIIPEKKVVYISNEGIEIPIKDDFEFLEGDGYRWVEGKQSGDNIPEGAVSTGISDDGRRVYVGRGRHLDIWIPGKVLEADYGVYIPYSTKEHRLTTYEILVCPLSPPPPPCSAPKPETVAAAVEPVPDSSIDLPTEKLPQSPTDKDSEIPKEETTPKNDDDDSPKCEDDNMQVASSPGTETIGNTPNWVRSEFDNIPPKAVIIGEDTDKSITYVGRAKNLPAKIIPEKEVVYISNEGIENPIKDDFEFLEGDGYRWVEGKQSGDNIPEGAVSTGISDDGRRVYVGRGRHLDIWIPGKVFEADYGVYIPYSTKEHRLTTYEILVCPLSPPPPPCSAPNPETVAAAVEPVPDSSIDLPTEKLPQSPTDKDSEIPKEETTPKNDDDDSPKCEDDNMQVASFPGTETIGNTPNWVRSEFDNIPPKAVIIGEDTDKTITYVGRAKNLPAKIIPEKEVVYISNEGIEIPIKDDFEFLEGDGYRWVEGKQSGDNIPEGAVSTGISDDGRRVYVGRGRHLDIWIPGKVFEADYGVYIPYSTKEHRLTTYEILVCPLSPPPPPCSNPNPETVAAAVEPVPDSSIDLPTEKLPQSPTDKDSEIPKEETTPKNDDDDSPKCEDDNMQVASFPGTETIGNTPNWVRSEFDNIPPKAVIIGEDTDKTITYVGRAKNLPAKIIPEKKVVFISVDGFEILIRDDFEFLEGDGYRWVEGKQCGNNIPKGAVSTGISGDGRRVYVGRGRHLNIWIPGKVFEADYSVYVPYYYREHRLTTYEILVLD